jgi:hypothetical protein
VRLEEFAHSNARTADAATVTVTDRFPKGSFLSGSS